MSFSSRNTDKKLIERIASSIRSGRLSHAYILEGDSVSDKEGFAMDFFEAVMCEKDPGYGCTDEQPCINCRKLRHGNYEDLYVVRAEYGSSRNVKSVKKQDIEELRFNLLKKPAGRRNLALICDADTMTRESQNGFLKTLEEPPEGTVILLLSENSENLLETIRSRAIIYRLDSTGQAGEEKMQQAESIIDAVLRHESFLTVKNLITSAVSSREDAVAVLDCMERIYRDIMVEKDSRRKLMKKEDAFYNIQVVEDARKDILVHKAAQVNVLKKAALQLR